MKQAISSIPTYSISEIIAGNGMKVPAKDFHVFRNNELVNKEKILLRPIRSDHFIIVLVVEGEAKIQLNLIDYTLTTNSLFLIPYNVVHQLGGNDGAPKIVGMGFSLDFLTQAGMQKKYTQVFDFLSTQGNPHLNLTDEEAGTLQTLMLLLKRKDMQEEDLPFRSEAILSGFNFFMFEIASLYRKYNPNEIIKLTRKEGILMQFVKLLTEHGKEERSVQYYADEMFMTSKHLTKSIKELTNKTAGEMIDDMVITEAKILLDNLDMSVANVADALHFSDQFFFSKFFKKHAGVNPSEYKSTL